LFLLLFGLFQQPDSQILRRRANKFELLIYKPNLLNQFLGRRRLSELHSLDKGILEGCAEDVRRLDLEYIITQSDQISYRVLVHFFARFHEGLHLPLLVVARIKLLVLRARRNDLDAAELCINAGQETLGGKLDPALGCIRHYYNTTQAFRFYDELVGYRVQFV
jgi:hypothetical protein